MSFIAIVFTNKECAFVKLVRDKKKNMDIFNNHQYIYSSIHSSFLQFIHPLIYSYIYP